MKNTFGSSVAVTIFGESHGKAVGAVIDGLCPGIRVDDERIKHELTKRRPALLTDTKRSEPDEYSILSGVFNGKTTGTPICIVIPNVNTKSSDYSYGEARPSHADYTAYRKYHGYEDYRGGGHFSGRVSAALTAVGAILYEALEGIGIKTATHIYRCGGFADREFSDFNADYNLLDNRLFPVLDEKSGTLMQSFIENAAATGDSVGGVTQTVVFGVMPGVGEPLFDSAEGILSHALFSIGGIKGVEFGGGFSAAVGKGSEFNDAMRVKNGEIFTLSNNNGGINGGITNGMPIVFQCAVKPTPSIGMVQQTVDFIKGENTEISVSGRHDPAIIRRICPVINSVTAMVMCDMLAFRFGTDVFYKG